MSSRSDGRLRDLERLIAPPWAVASALMILVIWGNSLVPGDESSGLSLAVVAFVRGVLDGAGLPSAWVTNLLVRKAAHFTEYAVLGVLVGQALDPEHRADRAAIVPAALVLVLVPSIDECIQLFVPGRAGRLTDVLIDCSGAAVATALRAFIVRRRLRVTRGTSVRGTSAQRR